MYQFDEAYAFVRLADAQRILKMGDTVSGIEIRVKDIYQADKIAEQIKKISGLSLLDQRLDADERQSFLCAQT